MKKCAWCGMEVTDYVVGQYCSQNCAQDDYDARKWIKRKRTCLGDEESENSSIDSRYDEEYDGDYELNFDFDNFIEDQ